MAAPNSIGSFATIFASLGALFFIAMAFAMDAEFRQASVSTSGEGFVGYAVMAWLGLVFVAFSWAGAWYSLKGRHFSLAVAGSVAATLACLVEYVVLWFAPHSAIVMPLAYTWSVPIIVQSVLALAGLAFTVKSKSRFT